MVYSSRLTLFFVLATVGSGCVSCNSRNRANGQHRGRDENPTALFSGDIAQRQKEHGAKTGDVQASTYYLNNEPPVQETGIWAENVDSSVTVTVTAGADVTYDQPQTLVFQRSGDTLSFLSLSLTRLENAPAATGPAPTACFRALGGSGVRRRRPRPVRPVRRELADRRGSAHRGRARPGRPGSRPGSRLVRVARSWRWWSGRSRRNRRPRSRKPR